MHYSLAEMKYDVYLFFPNVYIPHKTLYSLYSQIGIEIT